MFLTSWFISKELLMDTQSAGKTERWAKASRVFGYLSFGLVVLPFILTINSGPIGNESAFFILMLCPNFGALIIGLSGCITAIIALGKIRKGDGDKKITKMATFGFILSSLGVFIILFQVTHP
jgi:hypothetical protein